MISRLIGLTIVIGLSGCVSSGKVDQVDPNLLVGKWYGESMNGNEQTIWLNERTADGQFTLTFKKCRGNQQTFIQRKEGTWSVKGKTYQTVTTQLSDDKISWTPATPNRTHVENYTLTRYYQGTIYYENNKGQDFSAQKTIAGYVLECGQKPTFNTQAPAGLNESGLDQSDPNAAGAGEPPVRARVGRGR